MPKPTPARYKIAIIGCGKMGSRWVEQFVTEPRWDLVCICECDPDRRRAAASLAPKSRISNDFDAVLADRSINTVGLFTLADLRAEQIRRALAAGKHVIAEKPIAADLATEEALLAEIEASDRLVAVNLFNRNAWYHHNIRRFITEGKIGQLGIIRICHMTCGRLPGEGHLPEGPVFRDCGMHYVDVARWYAASEYDQWHAHAVRLWSEPEPWWVTSHGRFQNGIVFELTVGFVYGQMAKDPTNRGYLEAIGTRGIARYEHDFANVQVKMHGVGETVNKTGPYGGKKLDVMIDLFTRSLDAGRDLGLPSARDSVIASGIAHRMHKDAVANIPPCIGDKTELEYVRKHKQGQPG